MNNKKSSANFIIEKFKEEYPISKCTLDFKSPLELLIAIRLSAQCTDERVNKVTPNLFAHYKTLEDFANADPYTIGKYIYSCGFYKTKSQSIIEMCKLILTKFKGMIPDNMDDLLSLPGIGRKTANLFLGEVYGRPGLVVDTHFIKVTKRLGFHNIKDPLKVETIMSKYIPPDESLSFCHRIVRHGREFCTAHNPKCLQCFINSVCDYYKMQIVGN